MEKKNRKVGPVEKLRFLTVLIAAILTAAIFFFSYGRNAYDLCSSAGSDTQGGGGYSPTTLSPNQLIAILHYATSPIVPQQTFAEIRVSFDVLAALAPCNFLVFGLGHDSLMWSAFNGMGPTLFLEEDPRWVQSVLKQAPNLHALTVRYRTHVSDGDYLLSNYKYEPKCLPPNVGLRGNNDCKLALANLPDEVYDKEWDLIMIDAPRGYFPEAPGRMAAIFTAAVMARARTRPGVTHVFLHDVNRKVERDYAAEFLCKKNLVKAVGRLWHFKIPPAGIVNFTSFC